MKKSKMIGALSVISLSLCAFAVGMGGGNGGEKACAANATSDFYMENGASVRIDDKAGVRFSTHISESRYNAAKETAGDKEVKLVTIVNRADLGATHGAEKAMEFEYNLAGVSAKDGEYTVIARVTYSALEESLLLNAASVELEAKCYLVIGNDWATAVAAESNDNVRSMRSVAYAALTAGAVDKADVEKYLGTVQKETNASALLYTDAKAIDVSELTATYGGYTAAYIGAKKIGDVKNGKIDLAEAYSGTAETITLMDSANNVVTAPLKYAGDLSAEIKSHKYGSLAAMENGTVITLEKDGKQTTATVEGGKITAANLPAGTYSVKTNNYLNGELKITAGVKNESALTLEYKVFDLFKGWDEAQHDFSHVNDENPTISMKGNTLNVISRDKYNDVATSLWIKKGNSTNKSDVQGIVLKFSNGSYMFTRCEKMGDGNYKLQWVKELWNLPIAKAQWIDYQQPITAAQNTAFENADGLQLTAVRSGNILTVYVNGEKITGGTVVLDESYASMTVQTGFFDYDSKTNATWKFDIQSDISAYNTALEKTGSDERQYNNNVNLTGDVWQAMKLKVNAGYTGDVRIGFVAWHNGADGGYVKSINSNNGPWKLQETDSWKNEVTLSEEFASALTGEGLYLAYHRDAATGYVKVYAGETKAALESAIASGTAVSTFTFNPELKKKEITVVGVLFWKGDYTASATGYSYGATSEAVLAKLV